jgi:hypothetical protein
VKKLFRRKIVVLAICMVSSSARLFGQSPNEQLWFEYMLNYPFANSFNIENAFAYSTLLNSPRWRSLEYTPTLEYALGPHVDLTLSTTLSYTDQTDNYNTFEVRPAVGSRIHFTPNKRVLTRLQVRLEQRNLENLDTKDWEAVWRPRARLEALIPINKKSYFEDHLWYGIADIEWLFSADNDVHERFANRFRLRIGVGYRLSYSSRFEFIYMSQQSKNAIDESFYTSDNIFRFRYKQYLRKNKPTKLSGTGN